MLRILYVVSTLRRGGPTRQLLNLVSRLDRTRFAAKVLTLSPEPQDTLWHEFCHTGWDINSLRLSRLEGLVRGRALLQRAVQQYQPEIVHTHGIRADTMFAGVPRQFAHISVVRNFPQLDYPMTYGRIMGKIMALQHAKSMAQADVCVAVSGSVGANLRNAFNVERVVTIRNGVDLKKFQPVDPNTKKQIRRELGLPPDALIWVASGHLSELKRPREMIEAFRSYATGRNTHFVLVGAGPLESECRKAASDLPNVTFVGRVPDVMMYLQASDCFVSASKAEGMPNAVLEALACGLPVILSDIEPHREILSLEPSAGVLFPADSLDRLAELFGSYHPTKTAAGQATGLAVRHFSAQQTAELYQAIYTDLANREGAMRNSRPS